jgi:hypothetical protein
VTPPTQSGAATAAWLGSTARAGLIGLAMCMAGAANPHAQSPAFQSWHVTLAGGASAQTSYPIGNVDADLRRNATGAPPNVPLFRTESEIGGATAVDIRAAVAITRLLAVEVGGMISQPQLRVRIAADTEATGESFATERLSQYTVDVSGVLLLPDVGLGRRARLYALAGAGYLRQLHEGRIDVDTGSTIHAGAGGQYWFRGGDGRQRPLGLRGEVRLVHRNGGIDYEDRSRNYPTLSALLFLGL